MDNVDLHPCRDILHCRLNSSSCIVIPLSVVRIFHLPSHTAMFNFIPSQYAYMLTFLPPMSVFPMSHQIGPDKSLYTHSFPHRFQMPREMTMPPIIANYILRFFLCLRCFVSANVCHSVISRLPFAGCTSFNGPCPYTTSSECSVSCNSSRPEGSANMVFLATRPDSTP